MTPSKPARRRRRFTTVLAKIAGARQEVLDSAPGGQGRQAAMGGVILTTAVLAAGSATFALHMALSSPVWLSALFGVGWGVVIFNIDRMLVLGMGHERSWKRNLAMALPRVFLAFILGVVISTPLTLQIFNREIQAQLLVQQNNRQNDFNQQINGLTTSISSTRKEIATDQGIVAGGAQVDPLSDPRVKAARSSVTSALKYYKSQFAIYLRLSAAAQCEFNGTCGTHQVGNGPQYRSAKKLADSQDVVVRQAKQTLNTAQAQLGTAQREARRSAASNTTKKVTNAAADEKTAKGTLATQVSSKKRLESVFGSANRDDTGLLSRLEALDQLGSSHGTLRVAQIMLALLFLSIEILPVLMKLLLNIGKETAYERVAKEMDEEDFKTYEDNRKVRVSAKQAEIEAAKIRHSLLVSNEQDRVNGQEQVLKIVNDAVVEKQKEVVLGALQIWAEDATRESERILKQYRQQVNGTQTNRQQTPTPRPQNPTWGQQYPNPGPPTQQNPNPGPPTQQNSNSGPPTQPGLNNQGGIMYPTVEPGSDTSQPPHNQFLNDMDLPKPEDL